MNQNSNSQIKKGAIISYFTIIFNIVVGLIYTPWMVNLIGKSDYGLYILVTSFLAYFLVDFGLSQSITRFISRYVAENNVHKVNEFLGLTAKLYAILDLLILCVLVVIYLFIENIFVELTATELVRFKEVFIIAGFFSLISFPFKPIDGILSANEKFVFLKSSELISRIGSILLIILVLLMGYGLYALIIVNALVGFVIIVFKLIYLSRVTPIKVDFSFFSKKAFKELFNFSAWVTVSSLAQKFIITSTPAILAIFVGTTEIAIFGIAMTIEAYMWSFANALNGLFLPRISHLAVKEKNTKAIDRLMLKVGRIQLILFGGILVGFIAFGKEFIILWMGNDFIDSYYVGLLISITGIVTFTQVIGTTYMYVENKVKYLAIVNIFAATISLGMSLILTPKYGVIGSAISICVGLFFSNIIVMNIIYKKVLHLNVFNFFYQCHIKMIPPLGIVFLFGWVINEYFPVNTFLFFVIKIIVFGMGYLTTIWFIGANEEEKELIISYLKNIKLKNYEI